MSNTFDKIIQTTSQENRRALIGEMFGNIKNYSRSFYLDIFKKPEYYYLCFERDVSIECTFALDIYKSLNNKDPAKILSFESCISEHARNFWNSGYDNIVCFNTSDMLTNYTIEKFSLQNKKPFFSSDINDPILEKNDVILWLFDHIAYTKNPDNVIQIINNLHKLLNKNGILIIQSNSGVDISYLDYTTIFDNSNLDKDYFGKIIWSYNNPPKNTWSKSNKITKKIEILKKPSMELHEEIEYTSLEWVYNKQDMLEIYQQSEFNGGNLFFSDFEKSSYVPDSYETISVFIK